jgi:hypothetical protein
MFLVRDKDVIVVGLGGGTEQIQELGRSAGITHMTCQPLEERHRNMRLGHLLENFRHADYFLSFHTFRNRFLFIHFSFVGAFCTTRRHWQRSWWNNNDGDFKWGGLDVVCEKKSGRKEDVVLISVKQQLARKKRVCLRFKTSDVEVVGSHTPFTTTPYMKKKKILVDGFPSDFVTSASKSDT